MTDYDPTSREHRRALAERIIADLERAGFTRDRARAGEAVYTREREPNVLVLVYTSIVGGEVRAVGKDAIRVATIYTGAKVRPLGKETTIHRVGTIDAITGRLAERSRHALEVAIDRCDRCRAPTFLSGKGNRVCAAICWERHVTPVVAAAEPTPTRPEAEPMPITVLRGRRSPRAPLAVEW